MPWWIQVVEHSTHQQSIMIKNRFFLSFWVTLGFFLFPEGPNKSYFYPTRIEKEIFSHNYASGSSEKAKKCHRKLNHSSFSTVLGKFIEIFTRTPHQAFPRLPDWRKNYSTFLGNGVPLLRPQESTTDLEFQTQAPEKCWKIFFSTIWTTLKQKFLFFFPKYFFSLSPPCGFCYFRPKLFKILRNCIFIDFGECTVKFLTLGTPHLF